MKPQRHARYPMIGKPLPVERGTFFEKGPSERVRRRAFRGIVGVKRPNAKVR